MNATHTLQIKRLHAGLIESHFMQINRLPPNLMWLCRWRWHKLNRLNHGWNVFDFDGCAQRTIDFYLFKLYFRNIYLPKRNSDMDGLLMLFVLSVLRFFLGTSPSSKNRSNSIGAIYFTAWEYRIVKQKFSICIAYEANDPKISNYCNVSIFSMLHTHEDKTNHHLRRNANFADQYWRF